MPDVTEPASACALSSCLWEVSLLQHHAHPAVAALSTHVASLPVEDAAPPAPYGSSSVEVTHDVFVRLARMLLTPHLVSMQELTAAYSTARGGFKPAVPAPKPCIARRSTKESRQAAFERVLKLTQGAAEGDELAVADGLRSMFREARAFQQNAELRAQAGQLRALLARRSRAGHEAKRGVSGAGRKNK